MWRRKRCGFLSTAARIQAAEFDVFLCLVVFWNAVAIGSPLVVEVLRRRYAVCFYGAGFACWDWSVQFGEAAFPCAPVELLVSYF